MNFVPALRLPRLALLLALLITSVGAAAAARTRSETARVLAGLPIDAASLATVSNSTLERYIATTDEQWQEFEAEIGGAMSTWAAQEIAPHTGTVFYPFGGPDFTTVHRLYPDATRYVLVALQPAGRVPDLTSSSTYRGEVVAFFSSIMENFARRGFFITEEMNDQFVRSEGPVDGITPLLMALAEREGYTVVDVQPIRVNGTGSDIEPHDGDVAAERTWRSVRLTLERQSDGQTVHLDYLRMDLSDDNLDDTGADGAFVTAMSHHPVLLKAASHLPQYDTFEFIRDAMVGNAPTILQEETGIEYSLLDSAFEVRLYGRFTRVNTLWDATMQSSLIEAYANATNVPELPFAIGYRKQAGPCLQYAFRRR